MSDLVAVLVGQEMPISVVMWFPPEGPTDSGFLLRFADAPEDPGDTSDNDYRVMCLHCLIEAHPEVGRGLDLARNLLGEAYWDPQTGSWS